MMACDAEPPGDIPQTIHMPTAKESSEMCCLYSRKFLMTWVGTAYDHTALLFELGDTFFRRPN